MKKSRKSSVISKLYDYRINVTAESISF